MGRRIRSSSLSEPASSSKGKALPGHRAKDMEAQRLLGFRVNGLLDEPLGESCVWSYAVGHVLNDASAACWFSYLLVYLERVRSLTSLHSGIVMFAGQIFDAAATPVAGLLSDATDGYPKHGVGGRMLWYIVGTVLALTCFMGVFAFSPFERADSIYCVLYFAVCASLFNVGWAAVQVCHLAMIPELTREDAERVRLVKLRYAFTILSNLSVFLLYLHVPHGKGGTGIRRFKLITAVVLTVGSLCSIAFVYGVSRHNAHKYKQEHPSLGEGQAATTASSTVASDDSVASPTSNPQTSSYQSLSNSHTPGGGPEDMKEGGGDYASMHSLVGMARSQSDLRQPREWYDWFRIRDFWLCGCVYMSARIVVNITQVYVMFYLLDTLGLGDRELALVPLTLYLSGLGTTFGMERLNTLFGRQGSYLTGGLIVLLACAGFHTLAPATATYVYPCVFVLGVGSTTMMITAHSMANDLVAEHASSGFLFGIYSTLDKLSNGVLILGIQILKQRYCPLNDSAILNTPAAAVCSTLIRRVMVQLPVLSVFFSVVASWCLSPPPKEALGYKSSPAKLYRYSSFVDPLDQSWAVEDEWSDYVI